MLLLTAAVSLVAPAAAGLAHPSAPGDRLAWTTCSWTYEEAVGDDITYYIDQDGTDAMPADVVNPAGVINSFEDRIQDAAAQWRTHMILQGIDHLLVQAVPGEGIVEVHYQAFGDGDTPARTGVLVDAGCSDPGPSTFVVHGADNLLLDATIDIEPETFWFTQDDTRRAFWETQCPAAGGYTCSKTFDFGGTIVHEFGHVLGLEHPEYVDLHRGEVVGEGAASNLAKCISHPNHDGTAQASMCASLGFALHPHYRSERRTPETYDSDTLERHYNQN